MLGLLGWAEAAPKLAVFEVQGEVVDRASLTEAVRATAATEVGAILKVVAGDAIAALLPPGASLADCEGECALTTGRNLGVDFVLTSRVVAVGPRWQAICAVTRMEDGRLMGQGIGKAASPGAALRQAAHLAVQPLRPADVPAGLPVRIARPVLREGTPTLQLTAPVPTLVVIDGEDMGRTPVELVVERRRVVVEASARGHAPARFIVDAGPASGILEVLLEPTHGQVSLEWYHSPRDARVTLDGREVRRGRMMWLDPGRHTVQLTSDCFETLTRQIDVVAGTRRTVRLEPRRLCPAVQLVSPSQTNEVHIDGAWRRLPYRTDRLRAGKHELRVRRMGKERVVPITVPVAERARIDLTEELDAGVELAVNYRQNAGALGFVRVWSAPAAKEPVRTGWHFGIGLLVHPPEEDATLPIDPMTEDEAEGVGAFHFNLGRAWGVRLGRSWEWITQIDVGVGGSTHGPFGILATQTGLRFHWKLLTLDAGWGVAAHPFVEDASELHGLRFGLGLSD